MIIFLSSKQFSNYVYLIFKLDCSVNSRDVVLDKYNEPFSEFWGNL